MDPLTEVRGFPEDTGALASGWPEAWGEIRGRVQELLKDTGKRKGHSGISRETQLEPVLLEVGVSSPSETQSAQAQFQGHLSLHRYEDCTKTSHVLVPVEKRCVCGTAPPASGLEDGVPREFFSGTL